MGFDMRANIGRCHHFLLGGCIVLCIVLVCNWWSFSTQNSDLIKHIDVVEEQFKICSSEQDQCTSERHKLESNAGQFKIQVNQQEIIIKKQDNELTMCKTELESLKNLDIFKSDNLKTLRTNLDEKKEEIKRLNEQINTLKSENENLLAEQKKLKVLVKPNETKDQANKDDDVVLNEPTEQVGDRELQMSGTQL